MRFQRLSAMLAAAATMVALIPLGTSTAIAQAPDLEMEPIEHPIPKDELEPGNPGLTRTPLEALGAPKPAHGMLAVEILHELTEQAAIHLVESNGGIVQGTAAGMLVQALVPEGTTAALREADGVTSVRRPTVLETGPIADLPGGFDLGALQPQAVRGHEVTKTNADAWHAADLRGRGVKVGIIDTFSYDLWLAAQASGDLPGYAGAFWSVDGTSGTLFPDVGVEAGYHGVGVAEIVHEMAPDAELYVVTAYTAADLQAAVDYLAGRGVDIVTRSQAAAYDGPGDGTGVLAEIQKDAIRRGMVWLNAAGNHAGEQGEGGYWRMGWNDTDADGWLNFSGGIELMGATCGFFQGLRWNDWGSNKTDYDLYIFEDTAQAAVFDPNDPSTYEASSIDDQTAGLDPLEFPDWTCTSSTDIDLMAIYRYGGGSSNGDVLEIAMNHGLMEYSSNPYSAGQPFSDGNVQGAVSVGAIDPAPGTTIAPYSSRGPTNDGRIKPDLVAASCVRTRAFDVVGIDCFNGTSAATPAVAGALALVIESGAASSPAQLHNWLLGNALVDRGQAGPDNTYGRGELVLPGPPIDFADDDHSIFEADIEWLAAQGITQGCGDNVFCPDDVVTRGQMAAFLHRALPTLSVAGQAVFVDDDASVFEGDIEWLARTGVTRGCNPPANDRFCPNDAVTRGQMAAFLVRALGLDYVAGNPFGDDDVSVFEADIEALAAAGITSGCGTGRFCPDQPVTRGQMAAFLRRALTG